MEEIIYSRISENRSKDFLLLTAILKENDTKKVIKKNIFSEGLQHLLSIQKHYEILTNLFDNTPMNINTCTSEQERLVFVYNENKTLEKKLTELLCDNDFKGVISTIQNYFELYYQIPGLINFNQSDNFTKIFQNVEFSSKYRCLPSTNIDALFSNIMITNKGYEMIDYEWTFDFPIPIKFLTFRCLLWFISNTKIQAMLNGIDLYKVFEITDAEIEKFKSMENSFQNYVRGEITPMWKYVAALGHKQYDSQSLIEIFEQNIQVCTLKIYYDYGDGFTEKESDKFISDKLEESSFALIPVRLTTKKMRVDFPSGYCVLVVNKLFERGLNDSHINPKTNGKKISECSWLFFNENPYLEINVSETAREIIFEYSLSTLNIEQADVLNSYIENYETIANSLKLAKELEIKHVDYIDKLNVIISDNKEAIKMLTNERDAYKNKLTNRIWRRIFRRS